MYGNVVHFFELGGARTVRQTHPGAAGGGYDAIRYCNWNVVNCNLWSTVGSVVFYTNSGWDSSYMSYSYYHAGFWYCNYGGASGSNNNLRKPYPTNQASFESYCGWSGGSYSGS